MKKTNADLMTRPQLAAHFHVVPGTITRWEADGMPVASRAGRGRATRFDAAECHAWRACRDADGAVEFRSVERARARKDLAQAMEAEQRVAIKARTLVLAADAERVMADEYARCRGKLLGLSRKMQAVLPHLSAADITELDGLISEAVEELARA